VRQARSDFKLHTSNSPRPTSYSPPDSSRNCLSASRQFRSSSPAGHPRCSQICLARSAICSCVMERVAVAVPPEPMVSSPREDSLRSPFADWPRLPPVPVVLRVSFFAITCSVAKDFSSSLSIANRHSYEQGISAVRRISTAPQTVLIRADRSPRSNRDDTYIIRGKALLSERAADGTPSPAAKGRGRNRVADREGARHASSLPGHVKPSGRFND